MSDNALPGWFHQAGSHLGDQLVRGNRPGGIEAQVCFDLLPEPPGNINGRTEQAIGAGNIHEQMSVPISRFDQG